MRSVDAEGNVYNDLSIRVDRAVVRFLANGQEVATQSASAVDTEGVVGIRVHDNVDLHIYYLLVHQGGR